MLSVALAIGGAACGGTDHPASEGERVQRALEPSRPATASEGVREAGETLARALDDEEDRAAKPEGETAARTDEAVRRQGAIAEPETEPLETEAAEAETDAETDAEPDVSYAVATERGAGMVSNVGEALPVRPPGIATSEQRPCVCPAEDEEEPLAEELRALRRRARWRYPEGGAVDVAGGPPQGFERPPGTSAVYGEASVGGFDRDPDLADEAGREGVAARDANY